MNVFEDLIVELKEANLLENTVIDTDQHGGADTGNFDFTDGPDAIYDHPEDLESRDDSDHELIIGAAEVVENFDEPRPKREGEQLHTKERDRKDSYKERVMGEVSCLQMVEHILGAIERDYLKIEPRSFEDFRVKKALNAYLQVFGNEDPSGCAEAQQTLLQETEAWRLALAERDLDVPVSSVRQYCENTRPALSSQALRALARFYRNLPYTESVRAKFDFMITRLFSRAADFEKRACLFTRDETLVQLKQLYKDWSSASMDTNEGDESRILLTALGFEELSAEAENVATFDQLIGVDLVGRLRLFKESISELFFAPNVAAAAIDCNVRIGNAYVKLLERELMALDAKAIRAKYEGLNGSDVSDAAARTIDLVEVLRKRSEEIDSMEVDLDADETESPDERVIVADLKLKDQPESTSLLGRIPFVSGLQQNALSVNKWYVLVCVVLIAASIGLYIWTDYAVVEPTATGGVQAVNIDNTFMREHVKSVRIVGENFYAVLEPSWDVLTKQKRQDFMQKVYLAAVEKGCKQVVMIGKDGKVVGYASAARVDVVMP